MLKQDEQRLVDQVYTQGPGALFDAGYSVEAALAFIKRPDVAERLQLLEKEFKNQESFAARLRYLAKRQLAPFAPGAVAVLAQALAGPQYLRAADGTIRRDGKGRAMMINAGPDCGQVGAAREILDRLGVNSDPKQNANTQVEAINLVAFMGPVVDRGKLALDADPDPKSAEERVLSRERVRNAMARLIGLIPAGKVTLDETMKLVPKKFGPKKGATKKKPNNTMSSD